MTGGTIRVGRIVGVFGIQGWVKVEPMTDFPERFEKGARLLAGGERRQVQGQHWHKGQVRLKLRGIDTVEQAEALIGGYVEVGEDERPELEQDEYYTRDLIGLRAVDESGTELGRVDAVLPSPAHDLLQIGEALIPVVREFVLEIDLPGGRIVLRPLPGMLGDERVT